MPGIKIGLCDASGQRQMRRRSDMTDEIGITSRPKTRDLQLIQNPRNQLDISSISVILETNRPSDARDTIPSHENLFLLDFVDLILDSHDHRHHILLMAAISAARGRGRQQQTYSGFMPMAISS